MTIVLLWVLNVLIDTGGQLALKRATLVETPAGEPALWRWMHPARAPWVLTGIVCYVGEFVVWLAFLSVVPLSRGVLLGSINIVALAVAGRVLFGESLGPCRLAGIALIAFGVGVVGLEGL
ncbi:MAG: EamA family transporter [Gammaproteobacteria bacterium]